MRYLDLPDRGSKVAPVRVALIAGAYQEPEDFLRAGFADAARARNLAIDLQFISPGLQHLLDRDVLDALDVGIVAPARARGCTRLWLGGISLGAFIALAYAERRPMAVDGLCLLAPYLGNRIVIDEVARAGGVHAWSSSSSDDGDEERRVWRFAKTLPSLGIAVWLGTGRQDRFDKGQRLFADALPPASVDIVDGGHEWPVWLKLWERFLDGPARE